MLKFLFGAANDRKLKKMRPKIQRINALEKDFENLSDEALKAKTEEFKERIKGGTKLDDLLVEAFAVAREASKRVLGLRPYDVQLLGGMVLHSGAIAEMRTGEGKTLSAVLPVYLNALTGKGVHVVTVNDYLAKRDAEWMGQIYGFLGLTTGCIVHGLDDVERRKSYACDVTYGTNNEFGFDYLRDNMKYSFEDMAQRGHGYAIVDEVDSILIDEARTPLIISGPTEDRSDFYQTIDELIPHLVPEDYELDEKQRTVTLTEEGNEHIERLLKEHDLLEGEDLYDIENVSVVHHVNQALRAHTLYVKDRDYIVKDGQLMLIDEFTGRMMEGRRLSEGLHQALEAKEHVEIQPENVTLASITFQNYFRLYDKLAGMTGTAMTEEAEFQSTYGLDVYTIPTNKPIQRLDEDDEVYRTAEEKHEAILEDIKKSHTKGQPVLVGTASIEKSELLSSLLKKAKLKHNVLNARYHEQEAHIIAQAGVPGAITIATNMAGRGTDIQLGGNVDMRLQESLKGGETEEEKAVQEKRLKDEVDKLKTQALEAGGLYVLGTERHESRRIDNQLRGRTGRQGDQGKSKFYISIQDDLMRIFGSERLDGVMKRLGMKEGEAIAHPWMSKGIETSQKKVEQRNFEMRKNLLKYDDVMNDQRKAIFEQRRDYMAAEQVHDVVRDMIEETVHKLVTKHIPPKTYVDQWDVAGLKEDVQDVFHLSLPFDAWAQEEGIADQEIAERLIEAAQDAYAKKAVSFGPDILRNLEKQVLLQVIDKNWREHLNNLDNLRSVIGLRGYGQRDPLNEFKTEAFTLFEHMLDEVREDVTKIIMNIQLEQEDVPDFPPDNVLEDAREIHLDPETGLNEQGDGTHPSSPQAPLMSDKTPRNAPCPCGSGKKYKHCHGRIIQKAS